MEARTTTGESGRRVLRAVADQVFAAKVLREVGVVRPIGPGPLLRLLLTLKRWGLGPAAGYVNAASMCPDETAIVDDLGELSFAEVERRTNAIAHGLSDAGVAEGAGIGIMCRNHRGFVEATVAAAKLGARTIYANTAFAAPQLAEVVERERPDALIYDEEFAGLLERAGGDCARFVAWHDGPVAGVPTLDELIEAGSDDPPTPPAAAGQTVILTSGTTGSPKGANRESPQSLQPAVSLLSRIPLQRRGRALIAAPLFHSWGFAHFTLGLLLNATLVLRRRFDPEDCLAAVAANRADSLAVVPVMMQRILELPEEVRRRHDTSSLSVVAVSGSALPGDLSTTWMDEFGDTLYNLYGSTEVAVATIAGPEQMRAAPGTAGTPPRGTVMRLYDEDGRPVPPGETGRIFVGNEFLFEGYTGGGTKQEIDGLMATGDIGRLDAEGRLFVEGRDDEMIVSGGENVFPKEVEDLLARHDAVAEAAAIGVDDDEFGQRLLAFVALRDGGDASEDELKDYVKQNLARFKVPREIRFVDELPRNATGKVLKRELSERR